MKRKHIGYYYMGSEQIQLVARSGTGGEFRTAPKVGKLPIISVGMDYNHWWEVVSVLLHEVMEFCLYREGCRFDPTHDFSKDHSAYLFVANHPQFSNCIARTADFITPAIPELCTAYKSWKKLKK